MKMEPQKMFPISRLPFRAKPNTGNYKHGTAFTKKKMNDDYYLGRRFKINNSKCTQNFWSCWLRSFIPM